MASMGLRWMTAFLLAADSLGSQRLGSKEQAAARKKPFKLLFGSCNTARMPQWAWEPILDREPNAWLWLGDAVYGDLNNTNFNLLGAKWKAATPDHLRHLYHIQRTNRGYEELRNKVKIYGTWDDHDFGDDNADGTYEHKIESQAAFLDFIDEPLESPRRHQAGVYATHLLNDGRIRLILLDVRYNRTPYSEGINGDFLGKEQWEWLEHVLSKSTAEVHVIAGGIQFLAPRTTVLGFPVAESWSRFPASRQRLLNLILNSGIEAPILLSGDVHFAEFSEAMCHASSGVSTRIVEVTSSGMTHSWDSEGRIIESLLDVFLSLPGNSQNQVPGKIFKGQNFAEIEFDLDAERPSLLVRVFGKEGQVMSHRYPLESLSPPKESTASWKC